MIKNVIWKVQNPTMVWKIELKWNATNKKMWYIKEEKYGKNTWSTEFSRNPSKIALPPGHGDTTLKYYIRYAIYKHRINFINKPTLIRHHIHSQIQCSECLIVTQCTSDKFCPSCMNCIISQLNKKIFQQKMYTLMPRYMIVHDTFRIQHNARWKTCNEVNTFCASSNFARRRAPKSPIRLCDKSVIKRLSV